MTYRKKRGLLCVESKLAQGRTCRDLGLLWFFSGALQPCLHQCIEEILIAAQYSKSLGQQSLSLSFLFALFLSWACPLSHLPLLSLPAPLRDEASVESACIQRRGPSEQPRGCLRSCSSLPAASRLSHPPRGPAQPGLPFLLHLLCAVPSVSNNRPVETAAGLPYTENEPVSFLLPSPSSPS